MFLTMKNSKAAHKIQNISTESSVVKRTKQKEFQEWKKPFSKVEEKCNNNGDTQIYIFMKEV